MKEGATPEGLPAHEGRDATPSCPILFARTIGVYVEDQERAEDFYTNALGFEVRGRIPMDETHFWLEVSPPGENTRLVLYPKKLMEDWRERKLSVVFSCEDTRRAYETLRERGVEFVQEPKEMPWGFVFAIFKDPDGNEFGLTNQP